jgi:hypothetical protein
MVDYGKAFQSKEVRRRALMQAAKAKAEEKYTYHGDPNPKRKLVTLPVVSLQKEGQK